MAVYLHPTYRKPCRTPASHFEPDAAARLSGADCAAIAGYPDKSIRADEEIVCATVDRLLIAFCAPFLVAIGYLIAWAIVAVVAWAAG